MTDATAPALTPADEAHFLALTLDEAHALDAFVTWPHALREDVVRSVLDAGATFVEIRAAVLEAHERHPDGEQGHRHTTDDGLDYIAAALVKVARPSVVLADEGPTHLGDVPIDGGAVLIADPSHLPGDLLAEILDETRPGMIRGVVLVTPYGDGVLSLFDAEGTLVVDHTSPGPWQVAGPEHVAALVGREPALVRHR